MARVSIIAAVAANGVIGKNNLLPWHLPSELKLFRSLTLGKPVIIGRRTYEALPNTLDGRMLFVLSRKLTFSGNDFVRFVPSIKQALKQAADFGQEIMVAGGELVYQQFLPLADQLYISHVRGQYEGDAFFPRVTKKQWRPVSAANFGKFSFVTYQKS